MSERPRVAIGGTLAAAVLGVSPWCSPREAWRRLIERAVGAPEQDEPTGPQWLGAALEPTIRRRWLLAQRPRPRRLRLGVELDGAAVGAPECTGHPDAIVEWRRREPEVLEIKTVASWQSWGDAAADPASVPPVYLAQVQHYLALHPPARQARIVAAHRLSGETREYVVERDNRAVAEQLAAVRAWWARHVAPALGHLDAPQALAAFVPLDQAPPPVVIPDGAVQADDALAALIERLRAARSEAQSAAAAAAAAAAAQRALLEACVTRGARRVVGASGRALVTISTIERRALDKRALLAALPELERDPRVWTTSTYPRITLSDEEKTSDD